MEENDKSHIIAEICQAVLGGELERAAVVMRCTYPFTRPTVAGRKYTESDALRIFIRDGFVDRYSGRRLVFSPVLRLLSRLLPEEFPFHPNWKMDACHIAYWELSPTLDHVVPVTLGGADNATNWVCTSMLRNSVKANWTLEALGWHLVPLGDLHQWDGLLQWFVTYVEGHQELAQEPYFRRWHRAARSAWQQAL
ncbi:hypothetical protein SAMN05421880_12629 [Nitrosomonas nitrosa]|uniref:HNH endonuclease n=2 Tax=Nitrosomonas nitrosa TaxID=52442 RepID=A0A1I4SSM7_9PROT|nr:hypothetical protein SAMN05421880_12629 [Nitrosomonas nitrosa]